MAEFTLEASLNEAETSAAIAQAMAAGTITAAAGGHSLGGVAQGDGAAEKQAAARPKCTMSKTAKGTVYFSWGKNEPGTACSVCLTRDGWEKVSKVAAEILKDWERHPAEQDAQDPEGACGAQKKQAWLAKKAARTADKAA